MLPLKLLRKPSITKFCSRFRIVGKFSTDLLKVNPRTAKDVMLFKYDNPKHYRYLNLFALTQFGFWTYLAHFAYTTLRDAPVKETDTSALPWWRKVNFGEQKYRNGITTFCLLIGHLTLLASWSYTIRSVRFLVLKKGGQAVSVITYGPFGKNVIMDVPLKCMSAAESRANARVSLPIKVKGKIFFYMLDMRGEFLNKNLFDATAGLHRKL